MRCASILILDGFRAFSATSKDFPYSVSLVYLAQDLSLVVLECCLFVGPFVLRVWSMRAADFLVVDLILMSSILTLLASFPPLRHFRDLYCYLT